MGRCNFTQGTQTCNEANHIIKQLVNILRSLHALQSSTSSYHNSHVFARTGARSVTWFATIAEFGTFEIGGISHVAPVGPRADSCRTSSFVCDGREGSAVFQGR